MKNIYTSIDLGTDSIKIVVMELHKNKLNLLAASSFKSKGIKKGVISDIERATESLKNAIKEVEIMLGVSIRKAIASVPSYFANFIFTKSEVKITNENKTITSDDVGEVLKKSMADKITGDNGLVTILPIDFSVDDKEPVKDPKGIIGEVLSVRAILAVTPKKNIYSVVNLIEGIGIEVVDISLNSIGDSYVFKTKDNSNQIGAIINIGSEITEVSIYNKGIIVKNAIIGLGGQNVDNDISYIYKTSREHSKLIKERFALAHKLHASVNDFYEVKTTFGDIIKINQFEVSEVIMSRIEEILVLAKKEISILTNKNMQYIVITGGTSHLNHFNYIADDVFGKLVTVGDIKVVGARHNKYSSAIGNIIYFINKLKLKGKNYSMFSAEDVEDISTAKKGLINTGNDSMLGKVFGFFTSE